MIRDLSILVPAYNEARRITATVEKLESFGRGRFDAFEIVVIDDGSSDGTAELVKQRFGPPVRVVRRPERGGKGAALRTGMAEARGAWILFVDADLSIPIEELAKLEAALKGAPIAIGSKRAPGSEIDYPAARRFFGSIGQRIVSAFVVSGFHDTQCGFKLFRGDVGKRLFAAQKLDGFGFDFEVLYLAKRLGHEVREVPVRCEHQLGSTVRISSYLRVLREVGTVVWNRLRGAYPKR